MPALNLDQFDHQKLLLDAHKMHPTVTNVSKGLFGFITTITIGIPKGQFDWLRTEIGDVVGSGDTVFVSGDHDFGGSSDDGDFGEKHTTLLGLWREF